MFKSELTWAKFGGNQSLEVRERKGCKRSESHLFGSSSSPATGGGACWRRGGGCGVGWGCWGGVVRLGSVYMGVLSGIRWRVEPSFIDVKLNSVRLITMFVKLILVFEFDLSLSLILSSSICIHQYFLLILVNFNFIIKIKIL